MSWLGEGFLHAARQAAFHLPMPLERLLQRCYPAVLAANAADLPLVRWCGTAAGGVPASMLVAGPEPWSGYLAQRLFCAPATREPLGSFKPWTLERALPREGRSVDLTVIRVDRISARLFFRRPYLRVPAWVDLRCRPVDVAALARARGTVREDLRRIRHAHFSTAVSPGDSGWDVFYHRMYVPTMKERHGDSAYILDARACRRSLRSGGFIWLLRDGRRVGGHLFERRGRLLRCVCIGVLDGDLNLIPQGAFSALYIGAIAHARLEGCEWIGLGAARPSLTDGLLRYKAKWGSTLADCKRDYYRFLVRWDDWNPSVEALLSGTPLICRDAHGFSAVAVLPSPVPASQEDLDGLRHKLWVDGLRVLTIVSPAGWRNGVIPPPNTRLALPGSGFHPGEQLTGDPGCLGRAE